MSCAMSLRDACVNGHPWTPENTRVCYVHGKKRQRICRTCQAKRIADRTNELRALRSSKAKTLDPKTRKRLLDAREDGVSWSGLRERFGLTQDQLERELRDGR